MRTLPVIGLLYASLWAITPAAHGAAQLARPDYDWGFLASRYADVLGEVHQTAAGPFWETAVSTQNLHFVALRPFFDRVDDPAGHRQLHDWLWPIASRHTLNQETLSRYGIFLQFDHETDKPDNRKRLWLIPFYFQGRDLQGQRYWALFPLYGNLHEFLGRDRISFVLFPLHSTSTLNDLRTSNWLWPLISRTTGSKIYRARFFPFYGVSRTQGHYEKHFVLWPFWTSVKYLYPDQQGGGFILFPLYGRMSLPGEKTTWIVPPFFRFTDGKKMDLVNCPWPFFQWSRGAIHKTYVWPLWGYKRIGNAERTFALWPIFWNYHVREKQELTHRFLAVPFYRHLTVTRVPEWGGEESGVVVRKQRKFWPIFNYRMEHGVSVFRTLDLWPFADLASVDRNWSPLWTLYSRTAHAGDLDSQLLWGLYRHQRRGEVATYVSVFPLFSYTRDDERGRFRRWEILKGLVGREVVDSHRTWRLLYFLRFTQHRESSP